MPTASVSASPTPGPSGKRNLIGDALYDWCRQSHDYGHVFQQDDLFDSEIIPNRDILILLDAAQYLVSKHLFKIHDVKGQDSVAWEIIAPEIAKSYDGLTTDEQMVYSLIEGVGTTGVWTKTIKARLSAHAKVLDRVYKSLEGKQLIKQMKSVKNPGRKMYILYGLQPSEEATGGAWFTEGRLDTEMITGISDFVEKFCAEQSWREVVEDEDDVSLGTVRKRKQPDDGFDVKGKGKAVKMDDGKLDEKVALKSANSKSRHIRYEPFEAGHTQYPTVRDVSKEILEKNVMESGQALPNTALVQLLDVMVYDNRLFKMYRPVRSGEVPDNPMTGQVTMYRCFKNVGEVKKENIMRAKAQHGSRTTLRALELEDIGRGGTSEVPCLGCPNFDICGPGGEINAETCVYFDDWYTKMEEADRENNDLWPNPSKAIKPKIESSRR